MANLSATLGKLALSLALSKAGSRCAFDTYHFTRVLDLDWDRRAHLSHLLIEGVDRRCNKRKPTKLTATIGRVSNFQKLRKVLEWVGLVVL